MTPSNILAELARQRDAIEHTPLAANLGALFDAAVARHGDRLLWVPLQGGAPLSYRAFAADVARCTAALHGMGVGRGVHVAVMLPNVASVAITWMALAKLGAVMLPINTRYTARELDHVLREGDAALLVIDAEYVDLLARRDDPLPLPRNRIVLHGGSAPGLAGEWRALLPAAGPPPPLPEPEPGDLMTLQFTSGSTGSPKACMLAHLYWLTIAPARAHQGPPVSRMLIDMPFHYMGGQWRFLMALYLGATAYVAAQPSLSQMFDRLLAHDIAFCSVTPALAKQPPDLRRDRLRLSWAGTMALPRDLHAPLEERLGGAPVREMYGLTETGASLAMPVAVDWMTGSGAAGLAAPFRRVRIVDSGGHDVAPGGEGELWLSGAGMMDGYYRQPEATAAVLRDGWFRTGDLFRCDGDGFHSMLGRIKDVIRRNGENISATEVEFVLCAMPDIVDAAAIPVGDELRGEEVKVCLVLGSGLTAQDVPPATVLAFCRERLAKFKLPRYIAYVSALPKTPSGKTAKQQLRLPEQDLRVGCFDTIDEVWR